jgi:ferrous iron transport protein B
MEKDQPTVGVEEEERFGLLVGNANVGKSVVFNQLTGRYAEVSNYPGTTIEISTARLGLPSGDQYTLIDTPGINGLLPYSEDEKVTQRIIIDKNLEFIVQVADAKNLSRSLQLTLQLTELDLPMVLNLNMNDEAQQKGLSINTEDLAGHLGIQVINTTAPEGKGIGQLKKSIARAGETSPPRVYHPLIEEAIESIADLLGDHQAVSRLLAVLALSRDPFLGEWLEKRYPEEITGSVEEIVEKVEGRFNKPLNVVMATAREKVASNLAQMVTRRSPEAPGTLAEKIGVLTRRPLTGLPFFLLVIYLMYKIVGEFAAGTMVDFLEEVLFGQFINPWAQKMASYLPGTFLKDMFVGEFGLITMGLTYSVAIVLPIVGTFFLCFGFLEDSGYLPRLAIMSNRLFRRIGLNGKAILPMVLGLGCDTMATLTARILETRKERLLTIFLLALGIPCSAQLGVILAILATMTPWAAVFVIGAIASQLFLVGFLAARIIPGETSDFILEIPPIRLPRLSNLLVKTYLRVEWFLREAIPFFLLATFILFLGDKIGALSYLTRLASPVVVRWLSLPAETTTIFIMGFFRRDYGAAGLYDMSRAGLIDNNQVVISLIVITLFVPCIAQFLVMIKEQGYKRALAIVSFIFPFAFLIGGLAKIFLDLLNIRF